jgi:hypothetical protein
MTDPQIAEIAAKLTAAQRRTMRDTRDVLFTRDGRGIWPLRNALVDKGLADARYPLTPLGQSVAAYLKEQSDAE